MSVPNQKHIIIKKEPCDKDNLYTTINLQALQQAMQNLSGEAFKFWVYLSKNQQNYEFDLSQKAAEQWGLKKTQYYNNLEKLIEKGYLQRKDEHSNIYYFTETAFSEIRKEPTKKEYIISEIRKDNSGNQTEISAFQQRNNTDILQKNTIKKDGRAVTEKNNLDDDCKDILKEIEEDNKKGKFNRAQQKIIYELSEYLQRNCKTETTDTLYNEIASVYVKIYSQQ